MGCITHKLKKATRKIKSVFDAKSSSSGQKMYTIPSPAYEASVDSFISYFTPRFRQTRQTQNNLRDFPSEHENNVKQLVLKLLVELSMEDYHEVVSQSSQMREDNSKAKQKSAIVEVTESKYSHSVSLDTVCEQGDNTQGLPLQSLLFTMSMQREDVHEAENMTTALHQLSCRTKQSLSAPSTSALETLDEPLASECGTVVDTASDESLQLIDSPLLRSFILKCRSLSSSPLSRMTTPTAFNLLNSVFPAESLTKLKWEMGNTIAKQHADASVFFSDIVGFTDWCSSKSPSTVIECLSAYFQILDDVAERFGVYKVETIGDAWMGVCGAPNEELYHADIMGHFALEVLQTLVDLKEIFQSAHISIRMGIHCGPVVSGIVRADRPRWQLFGDTVNMASRMESTGLPGHIQISRDMYNALMQSPRTKFMCEYRGEMKIKGKGTQDTFFLKDLEIEKSASFSTAAMFHIEQDRLTVFNPEKLRQKSSPGESSGKSSMMGCLTFHNRPVTISDPECFTLLVSGSMEQKQGRRSLSRAADPSTCIRMEDKIEAAKYLAQKSILLIDSNISIIMQYRRVLKKTGLTVYTARNDYEALKLMKERSYIIVYMDPDVLKTNGVQWLQQFRDWESHHRTCTQPIFATLGDDSKFDQKDLLMLGFDGMVKKDGNRNTILKQVTSFQFT